MQAIIGKKLGMTSVFDDQGRQIPVTVLQAGPCRVVQVRTVARDGYAAAQLGFESQKAQRVNKPLTGHYKKAGVDPARCLREVRLAAGEEAKAGDTVTVELFKDATHVDVLGITKGKGFQGVVRRHGFAGGDATHGATRFHRRGGAIGNRTWPARIMKNKRMPGQMGNTHITTQNLRVVQLRLEDNILLVEGAVQGPVGNVIVIRKAIKKAAKKS